MPNKLPALQFYVGDWRKDPGVQSLDYFDRGVWFEILCLMHESNHRGKLLLNGRPMPDEALARVLGLDSQTLETSLKTLLEYGVAARDKEGVLMSRRMIRDEKIRKIRKKSGKKGGKTTASNSKGNKEKAVLLKQNGKQSAKQKPRSSSSSSSSSSISSSFKSQEARALPVNGRAGEQLQKWTNSISEIFDTKHLPDLPRWQKSVIHAIESNITLDQYSEAIKTLVSDPTRKFPVTPENVVSHVLQKRAAGNNKKETYEQRINRLAATEHSGALPPTGNDDRQTKPELREPTAQ